MTSSSTRNHWSRRSPPDSAECDSVPFELAGVAGKVFRPATVYGGGPAGQAGALRHAISKALVIMSAAFRGPIKERRPPDPRFSRERTEEVRTEGCQKALPILEAVTIDWSDRVLKEGSAAFPFYWRAHGGQQCVTRREAKMASVRVAVAGPADIPGPSWCGSSLNILMYNSQQSSEKSAGAAISAVYPHLQGSRETLIRSVGAGSPGGAGRCSVSCAPTRNPWVP